MSSLAKVVARLESMTPEQRKYLARLLREAADYVDTAIAEPVRVGELVWDCMVAIEHDWEKRHRPPAA
jgi:hypothetical protein